MNLSFEGFVAVRYLLARRKQAFISLISGISILGVMVGVMALLIALALMTGLQGELRDRIVGASAQIYVSKTGEGLVDYQADVARLKAIQHVVGAAPAVLGKGLLTSGDDQAPATVKGIDPSLEPEVTDIVKAMRSGSVDALRTSPDAMDGMILGIDLAKTLGVQRGDVVRLITPDEVLTPMGPEPRRRAFKVVGIFSLGLFEFDSEYALVNLPVAEHIFGKNHPDFIQLRLDDMFAAPRIADTIPAHLGSEYLAQDWADMNKSLFSALWLEKMAISVTIGLIVMVAALNIIASLVLLVMEKSRDIAILKTMGSSAGSIRRIFMLQGLIIGLVGTGMGALGGGIIIYILDRYRLIRVPIDVYQISYVPFTLLPFDFVVVIVCAMLICFVATIYPSRQASKLDPAQALRYQ
ncbi:MAG TPA: ABC transporter permease [Vicinamibacterales bacterium]|jgi:lipoprotein-releasing system permease protein|nr:ABC transporter permease [Vicinamibacterales bacterium]